MWFTASLFNKSNHLKKPENNLLWEENIVLIDAQDEADTRIKADVIGKEAVVQYAVSDGDTVRWTFEKIERICCVDAEKLGHGVELFSRFLKESEVKSLLTPF